MQPPPGPLHLPQRVPDHPQIGAAPGGDGALDALTTLVDRFAARVCLVSKCGPRVQARTLRWLDAHDVHDRTGLPRDHVRFCRQRPEKRDHCLELA